MSERTRSAERPGRYKRVFELARRWTIVRLLFCGGVTLVSIGVAGVLGLLGSLSRASLFNPPHWINWFHLFFGVFVLTVATIGNKQLQLSLALLAAVAGTLLGVADLLVGLSAEARNGMAEMADRSDAFTHLTVGILATWALVNSTRKDRPREFSRLKIESQ
jgi:hypothetical protein